MWQYVHWNNKCSTNTLSWHFLTFFRWATQITFRTVTDRRSGREEYSANFSGGTGYPALVRPFILKVCSGSDSVRPKFIALIFGLGSGSAANSRFGRNQFCYWLVTKKKYKENIHIFKLCSVFISLVQKHIIFMSESSTNKGLFKVCCIF